MKTRIDLSAVSQKQRGLIGSLIVETNAINVPEPRDKWHASRIIRALLKALDALGDRRAPSRRQRRAIVEHGLTAGEFYDMPATAIEADALLTRLDPEWGKREEVLVLGREMAAA